jgi:hypothetical protein
MPGLTYRPSWLMRCHQINEKRHDLARTIVLHPSHVVFVLVTTTQVSIALIASISFSHGIFDGTGGVAVHLGRDGSAA